MSNGQAVMLDVRHVWLKLATSFARFLPCLNSVYFIYARMSFNYHGW
jgi:hypothetical protein